MGERPLHCTIKNALPLTIGDLKSDFHTGCKVIDVSLSNIVNPEGDGRKKSFVSQLIEVGEIQFKNYYVAYITVKAKFRVSEKDGKGSEMKWRTCIKRMRLMPNPHVEGGSQDYFCITRKHMTVELINISALRIILQQPSPVWKEFKIEELRFFRSSETSRPNPLPAWLMDNTNTSGKKKIEHEDEFAFVMEKDTSALGVTNLETLSANLQQLWALSEEVAIHQTNKALGRYEVDNCYEINLLSYT